MKSTEKFIEESKLIHKNNYSYENVKYKGNRIDVIITCEKHGNFNQKPYNHLMGKGCPSCAGNKKITKDIFLKRSKFKHGDRYNYSLVDFESINKNVIIICKKHGNFEQSPRKHINGSGCPKCGGSERSNTKDFIKRSNIKHNNIYDYSLVEYINNKTKVDIICKKHGIFNQIPSNHLKGVGCPKCSKKHKPNNEDFIEKANLIHNYLYIYDNINYINCKTKIDIECKKHGIFKQTPSTHLRGSGCQKCRESKGEKNIEKYLISNSIKYKSQYIFNDLKYKKELKFDFAIFEGNDIKFLIEYNGEQHYIFRGQFGMKIKEFDEMIIRDKMKMDYCIKNGIDIHIIKYTDDINSRLYEIFK